MEGSGKTKSSNKAQQPPEFLAVGRIVRPHGVRGNLLVAAESEIIQCIASETQVFLGANHIAFTVRHFSSHRDQYLLSLEALNSREDAEAYREATLFVRFEDTSPLAEGVYFHWQLLGLNVVSDEDENLGTLEEIIETGANDVYLIHTHSGAELLLPAIESVIKSIDLEKNLMIVHLLPGLKPSSS
ncbi:MAG: 16S rRNA processing protein RimM [Chloroflexi bacterium RBG_16_48_8]|nr:MAG: 16S rRNA processing protein RimM [Chloroflexi bacterium RBG_16_48_8]